MSRKVSDEDKDGPIYPLPGHANKNGERWRDQNLTMYLDLH